MADIIEITDLSAPGPDVYSQFTEAQLLHYYEPNGGLFVAESPKVIGRALDAGCSPISLLLDRQEVYGQAAEIIERCGDIPVYVSDHETLVQLTGFNLTRGVLCAMKRPSLPDIQEVCRNASRIAILENVMNPTNVGAVFRSAAALGMDAILLTHGCSDPLYRRCARVSMGTVFQIPWTYISTEWSDETLSQLRAMGFKTAAMALCDDSVSIDDPKLMSEEKLAIILGTEGDGLADSTIADCDYTVRIPMFHGVDSLNVAAASAVAFWQLSVKKPLN